MEKRIHMEVEVKVPISDPEEIKKRILKEGGTLKREKHFESNFLYDFSDRSFSAQGCLLRVRELPEGALLTFKGKVLQHEKFKTRPEAETLCQDKQGIKNILHSIGLKVYFRYEKYREEYTLCNALVCIDELPFGFFMEIEGNEDDIEKVTDILALDRNSFSKKSYAAIYAEICRQAGKPFTDILFDPEK
ncbi:MAG: class IV adenylate cyclase [Acidobacteriota bacterium]|nr:class IV adenylate cyclase [Thermoanaerobaculaceae bacterium]